MPCRPGRRGHIAAFPDKLRPLTIKAATSSTRSPAADRDAEAAIRDEARRRLSRPWHHRRGVWRQPRRRRILLGDRSDRRHPLLHPRPAALGDADRADPRTAAVARPDGSTFHRRTLLERRDASLLPPHGSDQADAHAGLRRSAMRCSPPPAPTSSAPRTITSASTARPRRAPAALRRRLLQLLPARAGRRSTSWSRPASSPSTSSP